MNATRWAFTLALVALVLAGLLLIRDLGRGEADQNAALEREVEALRRDLEALEASAPATTPLLKRLIGLEARIHAIETRGAGLPDDLAHVRTIVEQIRAEERAERTLEHVRQRLALVGITVDPAIESDVVGIIARYTGSLLAVRESKSTVPGERYRGAREAHTRMAADLQALLAPDEARALIEAFPPPPAPPGPEAGDDG